MGSDKKHEMGESKMKEEIETAKKKRAISKKVGGKC